MAFEKYIWTTGDPITQEKMNRIENGIEEALAGNSSNLASINTINNNTIPNMNSSIGNLQSAINEIRSQYSQITDNASDGARAWSYVLAAMEHTGDTVTKDLQTRISGIEGYVTSLQTEVSAARKSKTNLVSKIDEIDLNISGLAGSITTINQKFASASGPSHNTVEARFESAESRITTNETQIDAMRREITTARGVNGTTLDARFSNIENEISTARGGTANLNARLANIESNANDLSTNKINKSQIANNLTTETAGFVLDATQGKELADRISTVNSTLGEGFNTTTNTVAAKITAAQQAALDDATAKANAAQAAAEATASTDAQSKADAAQAAAEATAAADATIKANAAIAAAATDATTKANTAKSEAIAAAATDATTKANAAEANAKTYADGKFTTANTAIQNLTTALENSVIVIDKPNSGSNYTNDEPNSTAVPSPSASVDYLIQADDDKYYYWRYINNNWELISGAGGSGGGGGTSSGEFAATLEDITSPNENTDYFVGNSSNGYLHYRYVSENFELIGTKPSAITRYNMSSHTEKDTNNEDVMYLDLYEFGYNSGNTIDDSTMTPIVSIPLPKGGGGSFAQNRVVRITPSPLTTTLNDDRIYIRFFFSSIDATGEPHEGTYTLRYNNSVIISRDTIAPGASDTVVSGWPSASRPAGYYEIDVTNYCQVGTQTFNLTVDVDGTKINRAWTVNILELRLESTAPNSQIIPIGQAINFSYQPFGAMQKVLHVKVDNVELPSETLSETISGTERTYRINSQSHGAHRIEMYLQAELNGESTSTEPIVREYIWYDAAQSDSIIIAAPVDNFNISQYSDITIPYTVYNSNLGSFNVEYYYDADTLIDEVVMTRSGEGELHFTAPESGPHTITIKVGNVTKTFTLSVEAQNITISPVDGAIIDFDPSTLSNHSINKLQQWTTLNGETYRMSVSPNFNWSDNQYGGGYQEDEDGKCFVVKAGTWVDFDYKMFTRNVDNSDPTDPVFSSKVFDNGVEMKLIFKVSDVRSADAVWFDNTGKPTVDSVKKVGIQLKAHEGSLKTTAASDEAQHLDGIDEDDSTQTDTVAATNTYLYFPYSEEDKIELDININRSGNSEDFIMSYEDGVPSKAYTYSATELLYQIPGQEATIRIGSPDCDVHIYKLRIYDKQLTTDEILRNFIADGQTIVDKVDRYNRNSIYYDSTKTQEGQNPFTPYAVGNAKLDPEQLAKKIPNVKVLMLETPNFTTSKKTFVKSTLRCIHAPGGLVFPGDEYEDNWLFENGYHAGQGTTSDNYGQAARNVDFLFECDGILNPSDKVEAEAGYVSQVTKGYGTESQDDEPEVCTGWKEDACKVSLTRTSVPNNFFNLKVNVASSENVNNALLQKRYNDFLPYISPASVNQHLKHPGYSDQVKVKNDMEFVPAVLFLRETDTTLANHKEFNDTDWHFYALGNLGDSKKTDYTRAYDPDDMNEFTIEISDNNTANSQFQSGVYISNNEHTVETSPIIMSSMNYIWDISDTEWNAVREPTEEEIADGEAAIAGNKKKIDVRTAPNGKVYVNYRHRMLSSEPFDGDHSFELRYACKGDYRDGKKVNDTTGQANAQLALNRKVWEAFYEWVVTSSEQQFISELSDWCVPDAVEFFYAFTHFYTMMDNRAKNTFWHWSKAVDRREVKRPFPGLLHIYEEEDGEGGYRPTSDTTIQAGKKYYSQYAFDLWVYDTDTAIGIDNNGELIFPYGREDTHFRKMGDPSSGYVFNGAGSIFWRRLSINFSADIATIFERVSERMCFDAQNLIDEFDRFQECFPEELWRLDIQRKYIRTFTGKSYDNSITDKKQNIRFLRDMMQGRKKYQRRQWVRDQGIYFGTKYQLSNVNVDTERIEVVCYTPVFENWSSSGYPIKNESNQITGYRAFTTNDFVVREESVNNVTTQHLYKCLVANNDSTWDATKWAESIMPNYNLKIVPYQDMYINVVVGNGELRSPGRVSAGETVYVDCTPSGEAKETRVYIQAGRYIQELGNLASMYIGANILGNAERLRKLNLGTDNIYYYNPNFTGLSINKHMPILEELNVKNCGSLTAPIDVSESYNLKIIEAEGTGITSLTLPNYTKIETLHLPTTITDITLNYAQSLTDFYIKNKSTQLEDYSNITNLRIVDSDRSNNINWLSIAQNALSRIDTLFLLNLMTSSIGDIDDLESIVSKKRALETEYDNQGNLITKVNLSGTVHVTGEWSTAEIDTYQEIWPLLDFETDDEQEVTRYKIIYKYDSNTFNGKEITTLYITPAQGATTLTIPEINNKNTYPNITIDVKPSIVEEYYVFGQLDQEGIYRPYSGWKLQGNNNPLTSQVIQLATIENNTVTLETVFYAVPQSYPLYWYMNRGDQNPIYIAKNQNNEVMQIQYGGTYNGHIPTVQDINTNKNNTYICKVASPYCGYKIFKGWEKAPVNLTLDEGETAYKIYATWETAGLDSSNNVITTGENKLEISSVLAPEGLTIPKLALLSYSSDLRTAKNSNNSNINLNLNDRLRLTMGYDGPSDGTLINGTSNPIRFRDAFAVPYNTTIVPFTTNNNAFTLVIDYRFNTNWNYENSGEAEAILVGCFEQRSSAKFGFKLYYDFADKCIRVGFGDSINYKNAYSKRITMSPESQYRNIIVLRHPANSTALYIYSGVYVNNDTGITQIASSLTDDYYESVLNWSNVNTNAPLIYGGTSIDGTNAENGVVNAKGTIYWSKYWNRDLGADECRLLAAWPHETMEFAVEDYQENSSPVIKRIGGVTMPNIILTTMTTSQYIGPLRRTIQDDFGSTFANNDIISWENSWQQTFSNQRIFYGLPIQLQALLSKTSVPLSQLSYMTNAGFNIMSSTINSQNYIFFPAFRELVINAPSYQGYQYESQAGYDWLKNINVNVYTYSGSSFSTEPSSATDRYKYMNLRFPYKALGTNIRVYTNYNSSSPIYDILKSTIRSGDIFIHENDQTAYMYITGEEISSGIYTMPNTGEFACESGAWIRAENWWSRSVVVTTQRTGQSPFRYVTASALIPDQATPTAPAALINHNSITGLENTAQGANICYSFGI